MRHYLLIVCLSALAIYIHGYQYAVSDQEIFIPYIAKAQDPDLFKNDLLFEQFSAQASIFYTTIAKVSNLFGLEVTFFAGYLIFQFLFFVGLYNLSKLLLKDDNLAYLSLLPFFLPKFIGGTATSTFDTFFGYRSVGVVFLIFYIFYLLKHQFIKASIAAAIGFWFHPLSIIPNLILLPVLHLAKSRFNLKETAIPLIVFSLISLLSALVSDINSGIVWSLFLNDSVWFSIIRLRDDYLFPSLWPLRGWLALFIYATLILTLLKIVRKESRRDILLILAASLSIFIINYLMLDLLKLPGYGKFQLARSITPLAYIALCISPLLLLSRGKIQRFLGLISFVGLSLNQFNLFQMFFIFLVLIKAFDTFRLTKKFVYSVDYRLIATVFMLTIFLNISINLESLLDIKQKIQFPKSRNDWIDVQLWAKVNTDIDDKFLVSPGQTGFRIFSGRAIVGDIKDGAVVIYNHQYAKKWFSTMRDLENFSDLDETKLQELKNQYDFDYLVISSNHNLNLKRVYFNRSFALYKI